MTFPVRTIAIACIALWLGACGSDKAPEGTKTDTLLAAADTIASPTDASTQPSEAATPAVVDSAGTLAATTTESAKTTPAPVAGSSPNPTATKEATPTSPAVPTRTTQPAPPKRSETKPPATPTPPAPTPPAPTPTPTPPTRATPPETADKGQTDPKSIFRNEKCGGCHTVTAQGINGEGEHDLSTVGTRRSFDWIMGFLNKQEKIDGKKHMKSWKGSDEDQKTIARWLSGLK